MGVPMDFNLIELVFTLQLEKNVADRFALFDLKPHFEAAFMQVAHCADSTFGQCARGDQCPYHQTFSQPLSADPTALKRYQKPSLPFVFQIPILPPLPNQGYSVELGLILAGSAVNFVADYIAATELMLLSPAFRRIATTSLLKVESAGYGGQRQCIMEPGQEFAAGLLATLSLQGLLESSLLSPHTVTLTIVTPMRILIEGKAMRRFSFSPFIRSIFRRVSSLAYYYGGSEAEPNFKWLAEQSSLVECTDVAYQWEARDSKRSGLTGRVTLQGDLTEYHPFLLAGEYLNVGKNATFGLGRYILEIAA
jgi:hypothetical protein